jgi:(S)-2-hydroxyglutarate dehydrogenase
LVNDFIIINQKHSTHVLNAISPAWTASFAFADHLIKLAKI